MRRWGPAMLAQGLAWLLALALLGAPGVDWREMLPVAALAGMLAALLSLGLREPRWRAPMQAAFAVAAGVGSRSAWPAWIWGAALALSLLVFGGGLTGRRAPLYLTQQRALDALLDCLPAEAAGQCLDVGAGLGSFLLRMAPLRPALRFSGIERSPLVCLLGDLRCRLAGVGRVRFGDLWQSSLSDYQVVYAFLSPEAMDGLWHKACTEMAGGTLLLVNAFPVPGVLADRCARYGEGASDCVYCYRLPGRAGTVAGAGTEASKRSPSPR